MFTRLQEEIEAQAKQLKNAYATQINELVNKLEEFHPHYNTYDQSKMQDIGKLPAEIKPLKQMLEQIQPLLFDPNKSIPIETCKELQKLWQEFEKKLVEEVAKNQKEIKAQIKNVSAIVTEVTNKVDQTQSNTRGKEISPESLEETYQVLSNNLKKITPTGVQPPIAEIDTIITYRARQEVAALFKQTLGDAANVKLPDQLEVSDLKTNKSDPTAKTALELLDKLRLSDEVETGKKGDGLVNLEKSEILAKFNAENVKKPGRNMSFTEMENQAIQRANSLSMTKKEFDQYYSLLGSASESFRTIKDALKTEISALLSNSYQTNIKKNIRTDEPTRFDKDSISIGVKAEEYVFTGKYLENRHTKITNLIQTANNKIAEAQALKNIAQMNTFTYTPALSTRIQKEIETEAKQLKHAYVTNINEMVNRLKEFSLHYIAYDQSKMQDIGKLPAEIESLKKMLEQIKPLLLDPSKSVPIKTCKELHDLWQKFEKELAVEAAINQMQIEFETKKVLAIVEKVTNKVDQTQVNTRSKEISPELLEEAYQLLSNNLKNITPTGVTPPITEIDTIITYRARQEVATLLKQTLSKATNVKLPDQMEASDLMANKSDRAAKTALELLDKLRLSDEFEHGKTITKSGKTTKIAGLDSLEKNEILVKFNSENEEKTGRNRNMSITEIATQETQGANALFMTKKEFDQYNSLLSSASENIKTIKDALKTEFSTVLNNSYQANIKGPKTDATKFDKNDISINTEAGKHVFTEKYLKNRQAKITDLIQTASDKIAEAQTLKNIAQLSASTFTPSIPTIASTTKVSTSISIGSNSQILARLSESTSSAPRTSISTSINMPSDAHKTLKEFAQPTTRQHGSVSSIQLNLDEAARIAKKVSTAGSAPPEKAPPLPSSPPKIKG